MKTKILFILYLQMPLWGYTQYPGCNVNDSLALVEFYWSTNGPNWTNNTNWLSGPVNTWYGVHASPDTVLGAPWRVVEIFLNSNNLTGTISPLLCNLSSLWGLLLMNNNTTGTIPACILNLGQLHEVYLSNNHLSGQLPSFSHCPLYDLRINNNEFQGDVPDSLVNHYAFGTFFINNNYLSYLPPKDTFIVAGQTYNISSNKFTFKDVLPYLGYTFLTCTYSPQDSVLEAYDTTITLGSSLILDSWVDTCQANKYHWKKNGVFLTTYPVTYSQHIKNNVQFADSGYYSCDITNVNASSLVLQRRIVLVHIVDSAVSIPKYIKPAYTIQYNLDEKCLEIKVDLGKSLYIKCYLYDMTGRKILRLYQGRVLRQDLRYYLGNIGISPGVYFVFLEAEDKNLIKKIILP